MKGEEGKGRGMGICLLINLGLTTPLVITSLIHCGLVMAVYNVDENK